MPQESESDVAPLRGAAARNAGIELQRSADAQRGLHAKPEDAMKKAKWAAPLREQPWMAQVVIEVAWFVRRDDPCREDLPYDKIAARADVPVDDDLSPEDTAAQIRRLVWQTLDLLAEIRPDWFEANIASQLGRRAAEVTQLSLDDLETGPTVGGGSSAAPPRRSDFVEPPVFRRVDLHVSLGIAAQRLDAALADLGATVPVPSDGWGADVLKVAAHAARLLADQGYSTRLALAIDEAEQEVEIPAIREAAALIAPQRLRDMSTAPAFLRAATATLLNAAEVI